MGKEGVPIDHFDPKRTIPKKAENARSWEYFEEVKANK